MLKSILTLLAAAGMALPLQAELRAVSTYQFPAHLEGGGDCSVSEIGIEKLFPFNPVSAPRDEYAVGAGIQATYLDLTDARLPNQRLYAFSLPLQASFATRSSTRIVARLTPSLNTDLKQVDDQDFRLGGFLLALYPWKPKLQVGAGMAVTDQTGFYGLMPIAGVRWQATDRLELDLFMPRPRLRYKPDDTWSIFLGVSPSGGQWNIGRGTASDPERDLHLKGFQTMAGATWSPRPGFEFTLSAGEVFVRSLKTDGPRGTEFRETLDLDNTPFIALSLNVKAPRPQN